MTSMRNFEVIVLMYAATAAIFPSSCQILSHRERLEALQCRLRAFSSDDFDVKTDLKGAWSEVS